MAAIVLEIVAIVSRNPRDRGVHDLNVAGRLALDRTAHPDAGLLVCRGGYRCGADGNPKPIPATIRANVILFSLMIFPQFCRSAVVVNAGVSACAQVWCHPDRPALHACLDPTGCRAGPGRAPSRRSRIRAHQITLQRIRGIGGNVASPELAAAAAAARWRPPRRLVS